MRAEVDIFIYPFFTLSLNHSAVIYIFLYWGLAHAVSVGGQSCVYYIFGRVRIGEHAEKNTGLFVNL